MPEPVLGAYYSGYPEPVKDAPARGAYGWRYENSLHALRMIAGGVFDRLPG